MSYLGPGSLSQTSAAEKALSGRTIPDKNTPFGASLGGGAERKVVGHQERHKTKKGGLGMSDKRPNNMGLFSCLQRVASARMPAINNLRVLPSGRGV
jgi:hypothetical protein